jgi:type I restriction enzyme M protein
MPHGVRFRGGAEKAIRESILKEGIVEAIIGLPPNLFYGTSIPACVLVINKNRPEEQKGSVLFINADAEYGEGRAQNYLRPEDLEKIIQVYRHHREIPRYSRLVTLDELTANDYNLNIRRYVDNSPEPEIEDVRAHLVGGVPKREVALYADQLARFGLGPEVVFVKRDADYYDFKPEIQNKTDIRPLIENHPNVKSRQAELEARLESWWRDAAKAIENFPGQNHLAEFRRHFQNTLLQALLPVGVLDEFQIVGIFVNWWEAERYDFKTIVAAGWSLNLIPDDYLLAYFQEEKVRLDELESRLVELDSEMSELLEETELEQETDEENKEKALAAAQVVQAMREESAAIADSDKSEAARLRALADSIAQKDKELRATKSELNRERVSLFGRVDKDGNLKTRGLIHEKREALSEGEARTLILKKLHDLVANELERYLKAQLREAVSIFEMLWNKYFVSLAELSKERDTKLSLLSNWLDKLGYSNDPND